MLPKIFLNPVNVNCILPFAHTKIVGIILASSSLSHHTSDSSTKSIGPTLKIYPESDHILASLPLDVHIVPSPTWNLCLNVTRWGLPWPPYLHLQAPPPCLAVSLYLLPALSAPQHLSLTYYIFTHYAPHNVNSKSSVYLLYPQGLEKCLRHSIKNFNKKFIFRLSQQECSSHKKKKNLICKIFWKIKVTISLL